jgi:hypothetical protein
VQATGVFYAKSIFGNVFLRNNNLTVCAYSKFALFNGMRGIAM